MKEFLCQWWPLLALILLGLLTSILCDIEKKKDVATSLGRFPDDPDDVMDRLEYKGRKYVKMWPSGSYFTEEFYNRMRPKITRRNKNMKANELMVGDWVKVTDDDTDDSFIGQVKAIDELGNINVPEGEDVAYPYSIDCLDPIPLTPEILEKNTSESNKNVFGGMNYALNADFFIENRGDRFCLSRRMAGHKYSTFWICDIQYVHELQHCLKLVGIEKEITL